MFHNVLLRVMYRNTPQYPVTQQHKVRGCSSETNRLDYVVMSFPSFECLRDAFGLFVVYVVLIFLTVTRIVPDKIQQGRKMVATLGRTCLICYIHIWYMVIFD